MNVSSTLLCTTLHRKDLCSFPSKRLWRALENLMLEILPPNPALLILLAYVSPRCALLHIVGKE
jgi:hypothetical protein